MLFRSEYFSKALGEKTIERDSISINRDRQNWKTGKSVSDQVMARALMTPDELRRMEDDDCIIFEKGVKPVKAKKFYYFKHPMAKKMAVVEISHNDIGEKDRGVWRKYNPYNPYVEEKDKSKQVADLKVESLDDLFDDEPLENRKEATTSQKKEISEPTPNSSSENKPQPPLHDLEMFDEDAPILPQDDSDMYDLQKELEAKFDELFGPID